MNKNEVDESDYKEWLENPITSKFFAIVKEDKETIKDIILNIDPSVEPYLERKISFCKGGLEICERVLGVTFEQLFLNEEENNDDDQEAPYSW